MSRAPAGANRPGRRASSPPLSPSSSSLKGACRAAPDAPDYAPARPLPHRYFGDADRWGEGGDGEKKGEGEGEGKGGSCEAVSDPHE